MEIETTNEYSNYILESGECISGYRCILLPPAFGIKFTKTHHVHMKINDKYIYSIALCYIEWMFNWSPHKTDRNVWN